MAIGDTPITVVGNVVNDPELRFTPSGAAVCNFRIASTPRKFNRQTNQWEDQEALFLTVNVWRDAAENVAETLSKGMRAIVTGQLRQRSYQTREGENRTAYEIEADEVGPSLRFASAHVNRNPREGNTPYQGGQGGFGGQSSGPRNAQQNQQAAAGYDGSNDPWNSAPQGGQQVMDENPPF